LPLVHRHLNSMDRAQMTSWSLSCSRYCSQSALALLQLLGQCFQVQQSQLSCLLTETTLNIFTKNKLQPSIIHRNRISIIQLILIHRNRISIIQLIYGLIHRNRISIIQLIYRLIHRNRILIHRSILPLEHRGKYPLLSHNPCVTYRLPVYIFLGTSINSPTAISASSSENRLPA
jgi:hypothetical protein